MGLPAGRQDVVPDPQDDEGCPLRQQVRDPDDEGEGGRRLRIIRPRLRQQVQLLDRVDAARQSYSG